MDGVRTHLGHGVRTHLGYGVRTHLGYRVRMGTHLGYGVRTHLGYGVRTQNPPWVWGEYPPRVQGQNGNPPRVWGEYPPRVRGPWAACRVSRGRCPSLHTTLPRQTTSTPAARTTWSKQWPRHHTGTTVLQLGIFMRALCPARTVLCPARI